ncbi:MAG: copper chaperone PCu(A)C [Pseudomonadota bacterium]
MKRLGAAAALLTLGACQPGGEVPLLISDLEVTPPRPGMQMSAGYFSLRNNTAKSIVVTRVDSPQFGAVEMHETTTVDGVSRMRPIESLRVEPGATVTLERGGKHLMLMRPADTLDTVVLNFYADETLLLSVAATTGPR